MVFILPINHVFIQVLILNILLIPTIGMVSVVVGIVAMEKEEQMVMVIVRKLQLLYLKVGRLLLQEDKIPINLKQLIILSKNLLKNKKNSLC